MVTPSLCLCAEMSDRRRVHSRLQLCPLRRGVLGLRLFDEGLELTPQVGDFLAKLLAGCPVFLRLIELGLELLRDRDRAVQKRQNTLLVRSSVLALCRFFQVLELGLLEFPAGLLGQLILPGFFYLRPELLDPFGHDILS
jgi:hypothetical protein